MWSREELKARGMAAFKANYWYCVVAGIILTAVMGGSAGISSRSSSDKVDDIVDNMGTIDPGTLITFIALFAAAMLVVVIVGIVWNIFVKNVFEVGGANFFIINSDQPAQLGELIEPFKASYGSTCLAMFMRDLFVWLWSLLLIIPGIIKHYEYYMVPYILADNPGISWEEALAESKMMMNGNKMDTFVLELSFIGWGLLTLCTCGILGVFYVTPYIHATKAELYKELRG